jgi:hypothetical protein
MKLNINNYKNNRNYIDLGDLGTELKELKDELKDSKEIFNKNK